MVQLNRRRNVRVRKDFKSNSYPVFVAKTKPLLLVAYLELNGVSSQKYREFLGNSRLWRFIKTYKSYAIVGRDRGSRNQTTRLYYVQFCIGSGERLGKEILQDFHAGRAWSGGVW